MADNRQTRAKKNIAVSLAGQIVTLICGLIVPGAMIRAFGSEAYGATASITQFLAYITLLEGGEAESVVVIPTTIVKADNVKDYLDENNTVY